MVKILEESQIWLLCRINSRNILEDIQKRDYHEKDFEKLNLLMDIGIRHVVQLWGRGLLSGLYELHCSSQTAG